ncbi:MAG TPA: prolipoprotein diacylglyceryl transferase [Clostridiaceae bacterium]|nr:prolipoprotein diacylglyceryl transferase [Clostridiaceae bacterium]
MADYLVDFPGLGIYDLPINRSIVSFELFGREISIYWYGVIIAIAFLTCIFLSMRQAKSFGMSGDDIADYFLLILPLGMLGARLYYVAFQWEAFAGNWRAIFDTRTGGLAFYGGVIGGVLAIIIMALIKKHKLSRIFDFFAVYLPLGQAIGRWGNFFNQEAFGGNTDLPWGMYSNGTEAFIKSLTVQDRRLLSPLEASQPVHPTFLYEFIANIIIFIILLQVRKRSKRPYTTMASYFLLYGLVRFLVEGLRTDPLYITGTDLRVSQVLSALMVVAALVYLLVSSFIKQRHPERAVTVAISKPVNAGDDEPQLQPDVEIAPEKSVADSQVDIISNESGHDEVPDLTSEETVTGEEADIASELEAVEREGVASTSVPPTKDTMMSSESDDETVFNEGVIQVEPEDRERFSD